jgi:hypothetical protein
MQIAEEKFVLFGMTIQRGIKVSCGNQINE